MVQAVNAPIFQAIGPNGVPYAGAKLYIYETGTTTLHTVYSDEALATPVANPIVADDSGVFASVFLSAATKFKMVLKDANGTTIQTRDPVYSVGVTDTIGADDVSYDNATSGLAATTVQDALDEIVTVTDHLDSTKAEASHTHTASAITDFSEAVDDRVDALLTEGTGISLTYNDGANTLTIATTGGTPDVQVFTSSGTWTKPAAATATSIVFVQMWSGGASGNTHSGGGEGVGGGGGAYIEFHVLAGSLGATQAVTVGAGGAAATDGTDGGSSSFYSKTVTGGKKPASQTTGDVGGGLSGAFSGSIYSGGATSSSSTYGGGGGSTGNTSSGGASIWGGGGGAGRAGGSGGTSIFGGAGGAAGVAGTAPSGGGGWNAAGAAGKVIITTYL